MPEALNLLVLEQVSRRFGGLVAVNQVSLGVATGEIFGLIGPNGAGKTTLFNLISGLMSPTSGGLFFAGDCITANSPHQRARCGIARTFQNIRLFKELSALENVVIGHHVHTRSSLWQGLLGLNQAEEQQILSHSLELLALMGLADRANQKAKNLAYADQRRLEIARALALGPKLLLLDEPAAGMNPLEKDRLCSLINQLRDQFSLTIVLIEHHVPLVMGICDRIAVLNFGELITVGEPRAVKENPAVIAAYLG